MIGRKTEEAEEKNDFEEIEITVDEKNEYLKEDEKVVYAMDNDFI